MSELDRLTRAFAGAVRGVIPGLGFYGFYEYRVAGQSAGRLDLQVVAKAIGLPDLLRVPARPGMAGGKADLAMGALVLTGFVGGDPARPFVAFYEDANGGGFLPTTATLDATGTVQIGPSAAHVELAANAATVLRDGDFVAIAGVQAGAGVLHVKLTLANTIGDPAPSKVKA